MTTSEDQRQDFFPFQQAAWKALPPMMPTQQRLLEVPRGQTGRATTTATTSGGRGGICVFFGALKNGLGCKFANTFKMGRKV